PLSVLLFTSQPLAALWSQSRKPALQVPIPHVLLVQTAVALGGAQVAPHAPQLATLVVVLVSQPSEATPLQSPKPVAHRRTVHPPPEQPLVATLASAQAWLHVPQLAGSIAVLAQYCVEPEPQAVKGDAQVVVHAPAEHTCPAGQAIPHAPQLALSLWRLAS